MDTSSAWRVAEIEAHRIRLTVPSVIGGNRNAPCFSRFQNSTRPEPSQATISILSARLVPKPSEPCTVPDRYQTASEKQHADAASLGRRESAHRKRGRHAVARGAGAAIACLS
jgi:hypothetical protein